MAQHLPVFQNPPKAQRVPDVRPVPRAKSQFSVRLPRPTSSQNDDVAKSNPFPTATLTYVTQPTTTPGPGSDPAHVWLCSISRRCIPTEITAPLVVGVAPVWCSPGRKGYYARIDVDPAWGFDDGPLRECDHIHPLEVDAWACAHSLLADLVRTVGR